MNDSMNTWAGWLLGAAIIAIGGSIATSKYFHTETPEKPGYAVESADGGAAEGAGAGPDIATLLASADIAKGEAVYAKCAACHTITPGGANGVGPNLYGVLGQKHGHIAGFAYSDALTSIPGNWDFNSMNEWLTSPRKYAPGTKMSFAGLGNPEDRANVIAYLNAQGSNLPLPTPAAAPAEGEAAADTAATGEPLPVEGAKGDGEPAAQGAPGAGATTEAQPPA